MILFISVFTSCFRNTPYTALFERRVGFPRYANEERYRTYTSRMQSCLNKKASINTQELKLFTKRLTTASFQ